MPWIQLRFTSCKEQAPIFEQLLLTMGASAVSYLEPQNQPIFEKIPYSYPMWDKPIIMGLFASDKNVHALAKWVATLYVQETHKAFPEYQIDILEDQVWERAWMEHFKPIKFGNRLWVCPSWHPLPEPPAISLILDPGLAFGTGTHPTTSLCLSWLEASNLAGLAVCDYGCGSGILGIAALILGATSLIAVDIDPKALTETRLNAKRNCIDVARYECYLSCKVPLRQHGLVVANILANPLLELASELQSITAPNGYLLLSGILQEQVEEVTQCYQQWFTILSQQVKEGWVCLVGRKYEI